MAQFNQTMLEQLVKEGLNRSHAAIRRDKYLILKEVRMCGNVFNIIRFGNERYIPEPLNGAKRCYVDLGEYLLSAGHKNNVLDLTSAALYKTADGTTCRIDISEIGSCNIGSVVVLDGKIVAVCGKCFPRFFAVVDDVLCELPPSSALNILLQKPYTAAQLKSLQNYYSEAGWEMHGGILINPDTLDVPTRLHLYFWHNCRKGIKAKMRDPLKFSLLFRALKRTDKDISGICYINSDQF